MTTLFEMLVRSMQKTDVDAQLIRACEARDLCDIHCALRAGADVNVVDFRGNPLLLDILFGQRDDNDMLIAEYLLMNGADPNYTDLLGNSYVVMACLRGYTDALKLLTAYGADVNSTVHCGHFPEDEASCNICFGSKSGDAADTALIIACCMGDAETVFILLSARANVNAVGRCGSTALMCAALYQDTDIFFALLSHGADPSYVAPDGSSASSWARRGGNQQIYDILRYMTGAAML